MKVDYLQFRPHKKLLKAELTGEKKICARPKIPGRVFSCGTIGREVRIIDWKISSNCC